MSQQTDFVEQLARKWCPGCLLETPLKPTALCVCKNLVAAIREANDVVLTRLDLAERVVEAAINLRQFMGDEANPSSVWKGFIEALAAWQEICDVQREFLSRPVILA